MPIEFPFLVHDASAPVVLNSWSVVSNRGRIISFVFHQIVSDRSICAFVSDTATIASFCVVKFSDHANNQVSFVPAAYLQSSKNVKTKANGDYLFVHKDDRHQRGRGKLLFKGEYQLAWLTTFFFFIIVAVVLRYDEWMRRVLPRRRNITDRRLNVVEFCSASKRTINRKIGQRIPNTRKKKKTIGSSKI